MTKGFVMHGFMPPPRSTRASELQSQTRKLKQEQVRKSMERDGLRLYCNMIFNLGKYAREKICDETFPKYSWKDEFKPESKKVE